jgi:FlaG/FlaF family flagellin (archaellin)
MKTICLPSPLRNGFLAICMILAATFVGFAQSASNSIPVVTIEATVATGAWAGPDGVFTVYRSGDPAMFLNVYCCISGTASNGVDYQTIGSFVQLSNGVMSNVIVIQPINHGQTNVETVIVDLCPSPLMNPVNYSIGSPSSATVYLLPANTTNLPPSANIVSPTNGEVYYGPTNIPLLARASDPDGTVTKVEFFAGTNDLGRGFPLVLDPPGVNGVTGLVYFLNWRNVATNNYSLTAVATDDGGAATTSPAVNISVAPGPPPTNLPPVVRLVSPPSGSVFRAPVNIPIFAYAADADGSVTMVEFFAGTNSLGLGHEVAAVPAPSNYWGLLWSHAPLGTNIVLTAQAADNDGAATVSAPVTISVLASPPPPTNLPDIASIVATDPVAIEGTNFWVWPGETNASPTWAAWPGAVCRFFTNWGPKSATITVRRWGATNDDLRVPFGIGGTASNGVDYVAIPGGVTIPAGERNAPVTIMPIDDGPPDITTTVILTLTPSTNTPPDYLLGYPRRAAAIILDAGGPPPVSALLPDRCFHLVMPGPDAAWFGLEYSTDLANWRPVCTNQVVNGSIDFVDPDAPSDQARFYRALPITVPPLQ